MTDEKTTEEKKIKQQPPGINEAMLTVMREIGAIGKNQKNEQQKFFYRGISDIYDAAHKAMAAAGVYMLPDVVSHIREERTARGGGNLIYTFLMVRYKFVATDGSFQECVVCGEGMDSGDKSANKALAAAHKYAITQTFVTPYSEMVDGDADTPETSVRGGPTGKRGATGAPPPPPQPRHTVNPRTSVAAPPPHRAPAPSAQKQAITQEMYADNVKHTIAGIKTVEHLDEYLAQQKANLDRLATVNMELRDEIEQAAIYRRMELNPFEGGLE